MNCWDEKLFFGVACYWTHFLRKRINCPFLGLDLWTENRTTSFLRWCVLLPLLLPRHLPFQHNCEFGSWSVEGSRRYNSCFDDIGVIFDQATISVISWGLQFLFVSLCVFFCVDSVSINICPLCHCIDGGLWPQGRLSESVNFFGLPIAPAGSQV